MKDVLSVLSSHSQLHQWSCAASAHEFIAKIHGKIGLSDYPLQNEPSSQRGGFQFEAFLQSIGLSGRDGHHSVEDTASLIAKELAEQRFPLVSVPAAPNLTAWHILVAVPLGGEVALADPARHQLVTRSTAETLSLLTSAAASIPGRDKIHVLTYTDQ